MSINKVLLLGHLGKDPELRFTPQQIPVCRFSLATNDRRKDAQGNLVEKTEWHNIVVWNKQAETCTQYLKKGRQVFIEGRIQTNKWQDKEGKDRYTTEIIASTVQFIGGRGESTRNDEVEVSTTSEEVAAGQSLVASLSPADNLSGSSTVSATPGSKPASPAAAFADDDIPF